MTFRNGSRGLTAAERFYRVLLLLYPGDFRREHGVDAVELFRDRYRAEAERVS